jgi:hypothetical protein
MRAVESVPRLVVCASRCGAVKNWDLKREMFPLPLRRELPNQRLRNPLLKNPPLKRLLRAKLQLLQPDPRTTDAARPAFTNIFKTHWNELLSRWTGDWPIERALIPLLFRLDLAEKQRPGK